MKASEEVWADRKFAESWWDQDDLTCPVCGGYVNEYLDCEECGARYKQPTASDKAEAEYERSL